MEKDSKLNRWELNKIASPIFKKSSRGYTEEKYSKLIGMFFFPFVDLASLTLQVDSDSNFVKHVSRLSYVEARDVVGRVLARTNLNFSCELTAPHPIQNAVVLTVS